MEKLNDNKIKVAGIYTESDANGLGIRYVVFTQGCPHHCPGCHNPETHNMDGGYYKDIDEIVEEVRRNPLLTGVTFSGGDPFMQAKKMATLAKKLSEFKYDIMTYTGFRYEEILALANETNGYMELLENSDTLVDGRFVESLKDERLLFRGSSNQRILDTKRSIKLGMPIEKDLLEPTFTKFTNKYIKVS